MKVGATCVIPYHLKSRWHIAFLKLCIPIPTPVDERPCHDSSSQTPDFRQANTSLKNSADGIEDPPKKPQKRGEFARILITS